MLLFSFRFVLFLQKILLFVVRLTLYAKSLVSVFSNIVFNVGLAPQVLKKADMIRKNAVESILAERDILINVRNPFVVSRSSLLSIFSEDFYF